MRKIEQRAVCDVAGVQNVIFMCWKKMAFAMKFLNGKRLPRELRRIRPDLIIATDPTCYLLVRATTHSPTHFRNAGLVYGCHLPASDNPMFYPDLADEGYHPHKIKQLYVHE